MTIRLHQGDLPDDFQPASVIAVDTETMGLQPQRDKLCLVQLSNGDGSADLVQLAPFGYDCPNLKQVLGNPDVVKLFHFARFDLAVIAHYLRITAAPVYCTKIASRLVRTYTDQHGLKDLCRELLGVDISKQQQSSDWGAETLTQAQLEYAATDVLYLHAIKDRLDALLLREGRTALADACFRFLPARAALDLAGWQETDIFAHS